MRLSLEKTGLDESLVLERLSEFTQTPLLKRRDYPETGFLPEGFSLDHMRRRFFLPLSVEHDRVKIVINDPLDLSLISALETYFHPSAIDLRLGAREEIAMAVDRLHKDFEEADSLESGRDEDVEDNAAQLRDLAREASIVRLVDYLINKSLDMRGSDIHFEPFENEFVVRCRVDGILHDLERIPKKSQPAVTSRLKLMAGLDIAERRLPQDGGMKWRSLGRAIDIRLSAAPTLYGESVVLRLLENEGERYDLDGLGMTGEQLANVKDLMTRANGMILVTGPTGSGKTTTLYSILQRINSVEKKIITLEDPVEYKMEGINQIQVKPQINLTFANALRSLVRQDPDVLLIGEIRDGETANIAIESSLTGHLVLSTLHTKNAPGAVTRLRDLGVESFLIADSLLAVLAQRLIRVLCPHCRREYAAEQSEIDRMAEVLPEPAGIRLHAKSPQGCEECGRTGYHGRDGIFELLLMTGEVRSAVLSGRDAGTLGEIAGDRGYKSMLSHGFERVLAGETTISEILRVTSLG